MSKAGPDATFIRVKGDHMQNGQLKLGYNAQISTNTQYTVNYTTTQVTADTTVLKAPLTEHQESFYRTPEPLQLMPATAAKKTFKP